MGDQNARKGRVAAAAFVMAFVKGEEIDGYLGAGQTKWAIARFYDRNVDTVERAIALIKENLQAIGKRDIMTVARKVWRDALGWERFPSFLEARGYIERGELMPKTTMQPRRKSRKRPANSDGNSASQRGNAPSNSPQPAAKPSTLETTPRPKNEPGHGPRSMPEIDSDDAELAAISRRLPASQQAAKAAESTTQPRGITP